jgi:hypothetical protein
MKQGRTRKNSPHSRDIPANGPGCSELGRPAEAFPPGEEAVDIYRELAAAMPDRYRSRLTQSL